MILYLFLKVLNVIYLKRHKYVEKFVRSHKRCLIANFIQIRGHMQMMLQMDDNLSLLNFFRMCLNNDDEGICKIWIMSRL